MSSPIIFEKGTRDFSTLGLGLLSDAIQATTTEELNGQFIFEMDYPVSGNNADLIKENRIIVVNSGHILKRQGFIIRQIVRKIDLTMTVYAEHVSYATLDVALSPIGTISGDAKTALENWKRMLVPAVDFTVDSDILTTNSTSIGAPEFETARQGLGGHAGSILDVWGGEYQFDNWHIRLLKQRGKSANAIIAYGRNLISFEQDTNIADTYTSVYPYYQENSGDEGNKNHFLPERTVDSEFVGKYPNPKVLMLDLSNKFKDVADYSETKLRNYALSYIQSNNIGVPKVNMKISTVDLSRATGGFSEDIDLGDTVNVYFEKLGITTSAKVIKAVWNVLSDYYDKFEIGARRSSLTESVSELATTADENANKALNQALVALQSADGKTTIYYLDSSDPWPTNPKENDAAFVKDGENSIMYRYMFNNDTGVFSWVKILDSMSADQIKQRVSDALESGKAYSDQLVADNVAQVNTVLDDVQAKQADLTAKQAELDTKAQGYANKALADAKADTLATATQTAKDAQEYTNTAKAEAISVATTADGVINQKIDDTASSITRTISQNKSDADGKISTAQSTATQALDGLTQKVSQNTYDAKVNELTGKISTAQQTADGAVTTIGNYKQYNDGRVASAESAIQQNASAITQKVSQTDYNQKTGELSGKISEISQTAGKISQSVADVNGRIDSISVGGTNLLLGTELDTVLVAGTEVNKYATIYSNIKSGVPYTFSTDITLSNTTENKVRVAVYKPDYMTVYLVNDTFKVDGTRNSWTFTVPSTVTGPALLLIYAGPFQKTTGITATYHHLKLEKGNLATDWSPAPEDTDNKISTVSQTVDGISSIVSDPTTGLTKRVQTAEGSISTVQSNVSDLQSKQTQTVSGLTTEISDRQNGDTNTLTQAKDFTTSSISSSESGMKSLVTQTSDAILGKIGAINLFPNSEFEKDYGYRTKNPGVTLSLGDKILVGTQYNGTVTVNATNKGWQGYWARNIGVQGGQKYSGSVLVHYTNGGVTGGYATLDRWFVDKDGNRINGGIGGTGKGTVAEVTNPYWTLLYFEGVTAPDNAVNLQVSLLTNDKGVGQTAIFAKPIVTATEKLQSYTPNNDITTQLALFKDNWSLGIRDNTSALASGIAGDLNGMTLISKKITLDGDTTVTGDFYAKGGNFKNINASNITVGNLDADEVRIINLDVNTLTGNVSRFLETNWDGAYGSTKITSTGMKINTQYIQADFQGFGMDFSYSNKKIGGMGISQYLNGEPGLSMRLESEGAYMAWSARNEGNSTGPYIDKLAWYRQGKPALGGNYGFIFSDRVTFNKPINVEGASINLGFRPINIYGNLFPFFGNQDNITGFAYTSNEIYMVLQNQYLNLSKVINALSGLGAWSVPTNIDSTGKVTQWRNVTT
ncbi:phage tail spike protein [Leuconostoc lactis]|uniref:phage tail spike protein n=1 Tax=Leuconostoc lactis TaxID=1246 RepID=UPI0006DC6018|nr:phage tail spike protein [Leuconostoc lactis]